VPDGWIGIDPGGTYTGIIARVGGECRQHKVVTRTWGDTLHIPVEYLRTVICVAESFVDGLTDCCGGVYLAVEGLHRPKGQIRIIDPAGLLGTAVVLGAVLAHRWEVRRVVMVPPAGNGSLPLLAYPEPIRAKGKGADRNRHARAAFDVTRLAERELQMELAYR
jgi:hypothetical protein